jgi:hypothetical protein
MANKNSSYQKTEKQYTDLFYMTPSDVNAKDIADLFQDTKDLNVQLWEEMNVLELELANQNSIDFEPMEPSFKDPSDSAFIKNRNIRTIFAINLCEADLNTMIPYFEQLVSRFSGFVCADSADFTPIYAGTAKR